MKKKLLMILLAIVSVFCLTFGLTACGDDSAPSSGNQPGGDQETQTDAPKYIGITASESAPDSPSQKPARASSYAASLTGSTFTDAELAEVIGAYYQGGANALGQSYPSKERGYGAYGKPGSTVYINIWFNNPKQHTILSLKLNDLKYQSGGAMASYFFEDAAEGYINCVSVAITLPANTFEYKSYTVTEIEYVEKGSVSDDGKEVLIAGNDTVMVGMPYESSLTASLGSIPEENITCNSATVPLSVTDENDFIAGGAWLRGVVFDANKTIVAQKSATKTSSSLSFTGLYQNTEYLAVLFRIMDNFDGEGVKVTILDKREFSTKDAFLGGKAEHAYHGTMRVTAEFSETTETIEYKKILVKEDSAVVKTYTVQEGDRDGRKLDATIAGIPGGTYTVEIVCGVQGTDTEFSYPLSGSVEMFTLGSLKINAVNNGSARYGIGNGFVMPFTITTGTNYPEFELVARLYTEDELGRPAYYGRYTVGCGEEKAYDHLTLKTAVSPRASSSNVAVLYVTDLKGLLTEYTNGVENCDYGVELFLSTAVKNQSTVTPVKVGLMNCYRTNEEKPAEVFSDQNGTLEVQECVYNKYWISSAISRIELVGDGEPVLLYPIKAQAYEPNAAAENNEEKDRLAEIYKKLCAGETPALPYYSGTWNLNDYTLSGSVSVRITYVTPVLSETEKTFSAALSAQTSHTHAYAETWTTDPYCHWHFGSCGHDYLIADINEHIYGAGVLSADESETVYTCSVCGYEKHVAVSHEDKDFSGLDNAQKEDYTDYKLFYTPELGYAGFVMPYYENGTYYLFYLKDGGGSYNNSVYLVETADFITYTNKGVALYASSSNSAAQDYWIGSGSVVKVGTTYYLFYTGHNEGLEVVEKVMVAKSENDLYHFEKVESFDITPVIEDLNPWYFRDPQVSYNAQTEKFEVLVATTNKERALVVKYLVPLNLVPGDITYGGVVYEGRAWGDDFAGILSPDLCQKEDVLYLTFTLDNGIFCFAKYDEGTSAFTGEYRVDGCCYYGAKHIANGTDSFMVGMVRRRAGSDNALWFEDSGSLLTTKINFNGNGDLYLSLLDYSAYFATAREAEDTVTLTTATGGNEYDGAVLSAVYESYLITGSFTFTTDKEDYDFGFVFGDNQRIRIIPKDSVMDFFVGDDYVTHVEHPYAPFVAGEAYNFTYVQEGSVGVLYIEGNGVITVRMHGTQGTDMGFYARNTDVTFTNLKVYTA